jgi:hypothetical protein
MAKYKDGNFIQFPRSVFPKLLPLKTSSKWLYVVLTELEHKYTGKNEDFFYRSIKDLSTDSGLSSDCIVRSLKELEQNNFIQKWQMHWWTNEEKTKKSRRHITAIRLLN